MRRLHSECEVARGGLRRNRPAWRRPSPEFDHEESVHRSVPGGGGQRRSDDGTGRLFRGPGGLLSACRGTRLVGQPVAGWSRLRARLRRVHPHQAGWRLTTARVSVIGALTRTLLVTLSAGCTPGPTPAVVLLDSEKVAGRARQASQTILLTTAPALVVASDDGRRVSRFSLEGRTRAGTKLWGLGELDGALYSVSGFNDFVRIKVDAGAATIDAAGRAAKPIGNVLDTAKGMAAQLAVDERASPLVWSIDSTGALSPLASPMRVRMGLSRAEEGLLHLLTCSAPPRALCWLPGSNQLLAFGEKGLALLAVLDSVQRIAPASLLDRPQSRSVHDALWLSPDTLAVAFDDERGRSVVGEFTSHGRMIRELASPAPVRLFLAAADDRIVAVSRSGHVMAVPR